MCSQVDMQELMWLLQWPLIRYRILWEQKFVLDVIGSFCFLFQCQGSLVFSRFYTYFSSSFTHILQMEPVPSGNLPPGFDPSTCRSV